MFVCFPAFIMKNIEFVQVVEFVQVAIDLGRVLAKRKKHLV